MKIAFLNPPFLDARYSRASRSPAVTKGGTLYYPLWLAAAAGLAEQQGHGVLLLDAPAAGLREDEIERRLAAFGPRLAVLDTTTASIGSDTAFAARLRRRFPATFVLLVGTHPSALPAATLAMDDALQAVALGEYDRTVCDLARALEEGKEPSSVAGLVLRQGKNFVPTPSRPRIEDLDALPFITAVYKKHLNCRDYFFAAAGYPMVMLMTGRGCPFRCFFCVYPQVFHGRRYRTRSPENVAAEFAYVEKEMPDIREIGIEDDCFTADPGRTRTICELLIRQRNKIPWYCNVRGDVPLELLRRMKAAGCRLVTVGFESGSQEVLDRMHKGLSVANYRRFAADARRAGILVHGCIMAGNPGDSRKTLDESYRFAVELNCDSMQFYPLYVYPGTEAYDWAEKSGILATVDFSRWLNSEGLHNCVIRTPDMDGDALLRLCDHYLVRYHLRPRYLLMKLWQAISHPAEGIRSLKSGRAFLAKLLTGKLG